MTTNILDIYERLYTASDNIKGETIDYNRGFQDCVYVLKMALEKYEHINMHLENKSLRRKLLLTDLNFDDSMFTIAELRKENKELKSLVRETNKINAVITEDMSLVNVELSGHAIDFYSNINQEQFNSHLSEIGNYVFNRLYKGKRNGKARHQQDYKVWVMQYLRDNGFKCVA